MFSSIGWPEIFVIVIVAFIVIGPDRLPGVIKELRAVQLAIKNAVGEARKQLDGEFGEELKNIAEPVKEFSEPIRKMNSYRTMSPKTFIAQTLFDGDDEDLTKAQEAVEKPVSMMRTTTPKKAIQDYFSTPAQPPKTATSPTDNTPSGNASHEFQANSEKPAASVPVEQNPAGNTQPSQAAQSAAPVAGQSGEASSTPGSEPPTSGNTSVQSSSAFDDVL